MEERAARSLLPAAAAAAAAALAAPRVLPDSYELAATGRCLLGLSSTAPPCDMLDLLFWSPGYPLLAGLLSAALPLAPLAAAGLVSLLAFAALVAAAGTLGERLAGAAGWWGAALLVASAPVLQGYAMLADPRCMALSLVFWGAALASGERPRPLIAGALAGLAAATRPEALAWIALLLPLLAWRRPLHGALGAAGAAATAGPYWLALSLRRGSLTLLPRGDQALGLALTPVIPEPWARQLIGESAVSTPLRELAGAAPLGDLPGGRGLDPLAGLAWLAGVLPEHLPLWLLAAALAGAVLCRRQRLALAATVLPALPALAATALPQGREQVLPLANLLPVVVAVLALAGAGLAAALERARRHLPRRRRAALGPAAAAALAALGSAAGISLELPDTPENTAAGARAAAWLAAAAPPGTPVLASYEAAPVVHRAGMRWVPYPSPWSPWPEPAPAFLVSVAADRRWWTPRGLATPPTLRLSPEASYGEGSLAVVIFSLSSQAP